MGPDDHRCEDKLWMKKQDMAKELGFIKASKIVTSTPACCNDAHLPCTRWSLNLCRAVGVGQRSTDNQSEERLRAHVPILAGTIAGTYHPGFRQQHFNTPSALDQTPRRCMMSLPNTAGGNSGIRTIRRWLWSPGTRLGATVARQVAYCVHAW